MEFQPRLRHSWVPTRRNRGPQVRQRGCPFLLCHVRYLSLASNEGVRKLKLVIPRAWNPTCETGHEGHLISKSARTDVLEPSSGPIRFIGLTFIASPSRSRTIFTADNDRMLRSKHRCDSIYAIQTPPSSPDATGSTYVRRKVRAQSCRKFKFPAFVNS